MKVRDKIFSKKTGTCRPALKRMALLVPAVVAASAFVAATDLSTTRQAELRYILEQDCGSCHGLTLKGGLGSALTVEGLRHLSMEQITTVILDGVPGTPMPPWRPMLSEQEAMFMAQMLKSGALMK